MPISQIATLQRRRTNDLGLFALAFALLTFLFMQHSLIWHAVDHLALSKGVASSALSERTGHTLISPVQKELNTEATCLKCVEDIAHAIALPSMWNISFAQTLHVISFLALQLGEVFLSPERANQRGPPNLV